MTRIHALAWPPRAPSLGVAHPRILHRELARGQRYRPERAQGTTGAAPLTRRGTIRAMRPLVHALFGSGRSDPAVGVKPLAGEGERDRAGHSRSKGAVMDRSVARCGGNALAALSRTGGVSLSEVSARPAAGGAERAEPDRLNGRAPPPRLPLSGRRAGRRHPERAVGHARQPLRAYCRQQDGSAEHVGSNGFFVLYNAGRKLFTFRGLSPCILTVPCSSSSRSLWRH